MISGIRRGWREGTGGLAGLILLAGLALAGEARGLGDRLTEKAHDLLSVEQAYFQERMESRWEAIYARQHPRFQEKISYALFVNRNGLVAYDTPEVHPKPGPVRGPLVPPPLPPDDRILPSYDALGLPTTRRYRFYANPWVRIEKVRYDKVAVSADGRFGRVELKLRVVETLPPNLFRVRMEIPQVRSHTDYWEFVEGRWRVALMVHRPAVSGTRLTTVYVPNALEEFNQVEWIEFDPSALSPRFPTGFQPVTLAEK